MSGLVASPPRGPPCLRSKRFQSGRPAMNSSPPARSRAAIFDLDGTIVDSMPFVIEAFVHAVEPYRATPTTDEVLAQLGGPLETCLRNLLGRQALKSLPAAKERLYAYEHGQESKLRPFQGARELLTLLKNEGVRLGIWTGRDRWSAVRTGRIPSFMSIPGNRPAVKIMLGRIPSFMRWNCEF